MNRPVVLSVGMTHPLNLAGVGLDLALAHRLDVRIVTVVAAISAQDSSHVRLVAPLEARILDAQFDALEWDDVRAIRVGALGAPENAACVERRLRAHASVPAVVDPVFAASTGEALARGDMLTAVRERLACLPNVVLTPNLAEAAQLLGTARVEPDQLESAAAQLQRRGNAAVLLKGGHLEGDAVDVLATGDGVHVFAGERIERDLRGTGCTLAIALAAALARGESIDRAVVAARSFVRARIADEGYRRDDRQTRVP